MKKTLILLTLILAPVSLAQQAAPQAGPQANPEMRAKMKARVLEKFDADGDGQLSDEERATAKAARQSKGDTAGSTPRQKKAAAGQGGPQGKNGSGGAQGKNGKGKQFRAKVRERVIEYFDQDGDGKLNESEREALKQKRQATRSEFDKDGDGKLSPEERKAMIESRPLKD